MTGYQGYKEREAQRERLVGATVAEVWVNGGESELRLVTDRGTLRLPVWGDCCSESWWADAVGVKQLLGGTVASIEEVDMPEPAEDDKRTRQEYDSIYGVRVTTDRGVCDLIFRNSSNGYYGGSTNYTWDAPTDDDYYTDAEEEFRQITEDWSA